MKTAYLIAKAEITDEQAAQMKLKGVDWKDADSPGSLKFQPTRAGTKNLRELHWIAGAFNLETVPGFAEILK